MDQRSNTNRIARNSLMLYLRMGLTMVVSLYTSRIILAALGVTDFGIYNVVGGLVILFAFLNNAMTTATQRFISYEIGLKERGQVARVFSMSMSVHIGLALVLILVAESVGLLLLKNLIQIPESKTGEAHLVYQLSLLTAVIKILQVPYSATIVAYERMTFYAYLGIAEAALGLATAFILSSVVTGRLRAYALLLLVSGTAILLIYRYYCRRSFPAASYHPVWDQKLFGQIFSFAGWSLLGNAANSGAAQGVNILFNTFSGVATNAAMGVANQVNTAITTFLGNFQTAFNPQIIKYFAVGDIAAAESFTIHSARFSYFLILIPSLILMINTETILGLWLTVVPAEAAAFTRIFVGCLLLNALNNPLIIAIQATGKIRAYQIGISSITILALPSAWLILRLGGHPYHALLSTLATIPLATVYRLRFLKNQIRFSIRRFARECLSRCLVVTLACLPLLLMIERQSRSFLWISTLAIVATSTSVIWLIGLRADERVLLLSAVGKLARRISSIVSIRSR